MPTKSKAVITREQLEKIFEEVDSQWEGDNAYKGCQILAKYTESIITGADHDVMYGPDIDDILEKGLTKEDAHALAMLNWTLDEDSDCLACFV